MSFCVISDGSCDLDPGYAAQRGIQVVPFYLSFDQKTYLREGQDIAVRAFYQRLVEDPTLFPTTSMPSTADYMDVFLPHARAGEDVLCICITTKFSGSYNSAMTAAAAVAEEYPGVRIRVLDAKVNTVLQGMLVSECARMRDSGLDVDAAFAQLETLRESGRIFFTVGNMEYLVHGGRVGKVLRLAGSTLQIRPIITLREGEIFPSGAAIGRNLSKKKVLEKALSYLKKLGDLSAYRFCVGHGWDQAEGAAFLESFVALLKELGYTGKVTLEQIGATIGVHTGPHPIGIGVLKKFEA